MANEICSKNFPSLKFAYRDTLDSLNLTIKRFDLLDNRIDQQLAWISSITIGVIAIVGVKGEMEYFTTPLFYIGISIFIIILTIAIYDKIRSTYLKWGTLSILNPENLYNEYVELKEDVYMYSIIHYESKAFKYNLNLINQKGRKIVLITILFAIEIVFLGLWLLSLKS